MLWILLAVLAGIGAIALVVARTNHTSKVRERAASKGITGEALTKVLADNAFAVPRAITVVLVASVFAFTSLGLFTKVFFYAEPGYVYHVRTILGDEKAVNDVGYNMYLFGRVNAWKKAMTVQASDDMVSVNAESESDDASANLASQNLTFLDQVDADVTATVRFRLPSDEDSFLALAREYRSPDNLLRTSLIPAFRETLQANASLMTAEEYFTGGRTAFNRDFEDQMQGGVYVVRRVESVADTREATDARAARATANASIEDQKPFEEDDQVILIVEKQLDANGQPKRKSQAFLDWGIQVIEGRVTNVEPNAAFKVRMEQRQQASADRSIARERRIQQEEERLLAIAKADRNIAERQGEAKVDQIERTTKQETIKQVAVTVAEQTKAEAAIQRDTAQIMLEKAKIDAQSVQVAADAESYKKRVIIQADNALAQKLEAEIEIQKVWAAAYAVRPVPTTVFGGGDGAGNPGSVDEVQRFLQLKTVEAAQNLNYNREVAVQKK